MSDFSARGGAARLALSLCLLGSTAGSAVAQPPAATPYSTINAAAAASPITVHPLRGGISMLEGSGGNIGVLSGGDGLLIVDCGIAASQQKIEDALGRLNSGPLRYAILTHWHWDHADGRTTVNAKSEQSMAAWKAAIRAL